jgi:hypothetical protein
MENATLCSKYRTGCIKSLTGTTFSKDSYMKMMPGMTAIICQIAKNWKKPAGQVCSVNCCQK